ncbi:hypothetical protein [Pseudoxanthomonas putridarboris]|uniref:Uncharacterized protein n=1 Tax=Pseudoxanthomonas putridarboris TaxID=752605 RepID=A0ABU9J4K6_9GAMM
MNIQKNRHVFVLFALFFGTHIFAKEGDSQKGRILCKESESPVFSFRIERSTKIASICKGARDSYLVYRFGRPGRVELQYPKDLNLGSWKLFKFSGYSRGGGIQNDAMGDYTLKFSNGNVEYTAFQEWRLIDNGYQIGMVVDVGNVRTVLKGKKESQVGALTLLDGNANMMNSE